MSQVISTFYNVFFTKYDIHFPPVIYVTILLYQFYIKGLDGKIGSVSIQAAFSPDQYLCVKADKLAYLCPRVNINATMDASFYIRRNRFFPGYDAFESSAQPNTFLRHQGFRVKLHEVTNTALYKNDASYKLERNVLLNQNILAKTSFQTWKGIHKQVNDDVDVISAEFTTDTQSVSSSMRLTF